MSEIILTGCKTKIKKKVFEYLPLTAENGEVSQIMLLFLTKLLWQSDLFPNASALVKLIQHIVMSFQACSNSAYLQHSGEPYRTIGPLVALNTEIPVKMKADTP